MAKDSGLELKVGAFVVAAMVCLTVFVVSVSDFSMFRKGDDYSVIFNYANGLKKGVPVRLAGIDAGFVKALSVYYDPTAMRTKVKVDIWVSRGVRVPAGARVMINQLGLLGEKYVEILPGDSNTPLPAGSQLSGEDPVAMETVMSSVGGIAGKLEATLTAVNERVLTEANGKALSQTLENIAEISLAIKNGDGTIGKLVGDPAVYNNLSLSLANIASLTHKLDSSEGTIGRFLTDPRVYTNLEELSADLKENPWKLFYRPKGK